MKSLGIRALLAVAGVALTLGYWTLRPSGSTAGSGIPARLWEGGGPLVTVELDSTAPARFSIWFSEHPPGEAEKRSLETSEPIQPGHRELRVQVPPAVGGHVEISAAGVPVGTRFAWKIRSGERLIAEHSETLDRPLDPGTVFGMDDLIEDFTTGKLADR